MEKDAPMWQRLFLMHLFNLLGFIIVTLLMLL